MTTFAPKIYQQQVLDTVEACFMACHQSPSPSIDFTAATQRLWGRGNAGYNSGSGPCCRPADNAGFGSTARCDG